MELGLRDKAVLVTGGTRGIGRAIALAYARDRARVAITYATDEAAATTVVQQIAAEGGSGVAARLDLAEPASIPAAVAQTAERFGGLDVLVANAVRWPIDARGPLAESDPDVPRTTSRASRTTYGNPFASAPLRDASPCPTTSPPRSCCSAHRQTATSPAHTSQSRAASTEPEDGVRSSVHSGSDRGERRMSAALAAQSTQFGTR